MIDLGILGDPAFVAVQCLNGLTQAMFLFLIASGLTLIFGVLGVLNFAHGSLYMLGAYLSYTIASLFVGRPSAFWVAPSSGIPPRRTGPAPRDLRPRAHHR